MAEELADMDMEALMEMMGEPMPEEGGGGGLGGLAALAGAGAGAGYVAVDPYRRELARLLATGPEDMTRRELFGKIFDAGRARWDESTKGMPRMDRIKAARGEMLKGLPQPKPVGMGTVARGKEMIRYGAHAAAPPLRTGTLGALSAASARTGAGLLSKMPWLKWLLFPGMGWLSAGLMAGEAGRLGWNQFVTKPRERTEKNLNAAHGIGGAFEAAKGEIEQQALADQLELLAQGSDLPKTPSNELAQILGTHDLSRLFQQRAPMPKPTFQQAMEMVGGVQ
jgi:hypothetical protein